MTSDAFVYTASGKRNILSLSTLYHTLLGLVKRIKGRRQGRVLLHFSSPLGFHFALLGIEAKGEKKDKKGVVCFVYLLGLFGFREDKKEKVFVT